MKSLTGCHVTVALSADIGGKLLFKTILDFKIFVIIAIDIVVSGDGDSSVMTKLTECQPYGTQTTIIKIECTNHLLRNYIQKVREVGEQKRNQLGPVPGELRGQVFGRLMRLRHAVTGAVKQHKQTPLQQRIF